MIKCIEDNYIQSEIENSAYDFQIELEKKDRVIVGVNDFKSEEDEVPPIQDIDKDLEKNQNISLKELRDERDNDEVSNCLSSLTIAARNGENIMPYILDAVRAYCTIGEMTSALESVHGRYKGSI